MEVWAVVIAALRAKRMQKKDAKKGSKKFEALSLSIVFLIEKRYFFGLSIEKID